MLKFKIEIACANEAFQNGQLTDELHLILHRVIHDLPNDIAVENPEFSRNLRDTNGNHVGFVELIEDKAKTEVVHEVRVPNFVEFILCDDDNTWSTEVREVPTGKDPQSWANATNTDARVLFIGVMNEDPEMFDGWQDPEPLALGEPLIVNEEPCMADDPDYNRNTDNDEVRCIACDVWTTMDNTVMVVNKDTFDNGDMCLSCWRATQT